MSEPIEELASLFEKWEAKAGVPTGCNEYESGVAKGYALCAIDICLLVERLKKGQSNATLP